MDSNVSNVKVKTVTPLTVLILGIVAAALSYNGVTIAGIIVGCIAAKKVKTYLEENNGETCTMVMVGSILSKVGIYLGIGVTVIYAVYFTFYFMMIFGYFGAIIAALFEALSNYTDFLLPVLF